MRIHINVNVFIVNTLPFSYSFYPQIFGGTRNTTLIYLIHKWLQIQI